MGRSHNLCARKVLWLAYALVAFALVSRATTPTPPDAHDALSTTAEVSAKAFSSDCIEWLTMISLSRRL